MRKSHLFLLVACLTASPLCLSYAMEALQNQPTGDSWKSQPLQPSSSSASQETFKKNQSAQDHLAKIFKVQGEVKVLKKNGSDWQSAKKNRVLEAGDQIITGKKSYVEIVYDDYFLNIARIDENTKAEFLSIEPTNLHLGDGSIFSALDGLAPQSQYQVSTPTAVAGVRGTYFDVMYQAESGNFSAATFPVPDDHTSEIFVQDILDNGVLGPEIHVQEGLQLELPSGADLRQDLVETISPERVQEANETVSEMTGHADHFEELRKEGEEQQTAPPAPGDDNRDKAFDKPNDGGDADAQLDSFVDSLMGTVDSTLLNAPPDKTGDGPVNHEDEGGEDLGSGNSPGGPEDPSNLSSLAELSGVSSEAVHSVDNTVASNGSDTNNSQSGGSGDCGH